MKKRFVITLVVMLFLVAMMTGGLMVAAPGMKESSLPSGSIATAISNADWRTDDNSSTPEVDITYTEVYEPWSGMYPERLTQRMTLSYKDGTQCLVSLGIICTFESGGLDFENDQVLDWNKLRNIASNFGTQSYFNESIKIATGITFRGFYIVNGTAAEITFINSTATNGWALIMDNICAGISYLNASTKIGHITLSTRDYSHNNQTLKESIADFSVAINGTMGVLGSIVYVPVELKFHVIHNVTSTVYKYGVDVNWSAHKDFPTASVPPFSPLQTGEDYTLVADDGFQANIYFMESDETIELHTFETNATNDTAIFSYAGTEYSRLFLTTHFKLNSVTECNTTRIFIENSGVYKGMNSSTIYVCFEGFKYNESSGLTFDPAVKVPSLIISTGQGIGWADLLLDVLGLSIVASIIIGFKRKKTLIDLSTA